MKKKLLLIGAIIFIISTVTILIVVGRHVKDDRMLSEEQVNLSREDNTHDSKNFSLSPVEEVKDREDAYTVVSYENANDEKEIGKNGVRQHIPIYTEEEEEECKEAYESLPEWNPGYGPEE